MGAVGTAHVGVSHIESLGLVVLEWNVVDSVADIANNVDHVIILADGVIFNEVDLVVLALIVVWSLLVKTESLAHLVALGVSLTRVESEDTLLTQISSFLEQYRILAEDGRVTEKVTRSLQVSDHEQELTLNVREVSKRGHDLLGTEVIVVGVFTPGGLINIWLSIDGLDTHEWLLKCIDHWW